MATITIILWHLLISTSMADSATLNQKDFLQALTNSQPSKHASVEIKKYNYLFIAGFLNEFLPAYFSENIEYLHQAGTDKEQIHIYYPPSNGSLYQNSDAIAAELKRLNKNSQKPWIIIAHSKGGFEALLFASKHTSLFLESVKRLYIVQAAFGSPVSDYANGEGQAIDSNLGLIATWNCNFALGVRYLLDSKINRGIYALTTNQAQRTLRHMWQYYDGNIKKIRSKISYVISKSPAYKTSYLLYCPSHYLETYYSENDGLILHDEQWVPDTGTLWADLEIDHTDTFLSFPISNTFSNYRNAFMKLLIEDL